MNKQVELDPEEELYHLQESTNEDGTINVEITEWYKKQNKARGEYVFIKFKLPSLKEDSVKMDWPKEASNDWEFVRLVNSLGYTLSSVNQIEGEKVKYDRENESIVVPNYMSRTERLRSGAEKELEYLHKNIDAVALGVLSSLSFILSTTGFYVAAANDEYFAENIHWIPSIIMVIIGFFGMFIAFGGLLLSISCHSSS